MNRQTSTVVSRTPSTASERIWRYGPLLLWIVFISFASTGGFSASKTSQLFRPLVLWFFPNLSEHGQETLHFLTRKLGHFTEYAILAYLARRAFITSSHEFIQRKWLQLGLVLVVTYSLLDEFHQRFEPTRTASIYDSGIDIIGGLTVLLLCRLWDNRSDRRKSRTYEQPAAR